MSAEQSARPVGVLESATRDGAFWIDGTRDGARKAAGEHQEQEALTDFARVDADDVHSTGYPVSMCDGGASLRLGHAQGTDRWLLDGRPLSGGDIVQLCCSGGWLSGRFECDAGTGGAPTFFFSIELGGGRVAQQKLVLPEGALLRRP